MANPVLNWSRKKSTALTLGLVPFSYYFELRCEFSNCSARVVNNTQEDKTPTDHDNQHNSEPSNNPGNVGKLGAPNSPGSAGGKFLPDSETLEHRMVCIWKAQTGAPAISPRTFTKLMPYPPRTPGVHPSPSISCPFSSYGICPKPRTALGSNGPQSSVTFHLPTQPRSSNHVGQYATDVTFIPAEIRIP